MNIRIIYPEKRIVSEHTIREWYYDAVDNGEVDVTNAIDLPVMIEQLEDAGIITVPKDHIVDAEDDTSIEEVYTEDQSSDDNDEPPEQDF